jgi:hypothetical protein
MWRIRRDRQPGSAPGLEATLHVGHVGDTKIEQ